jgi:hypothetical protein
MEEGTQKPGLTAGGWWYSIINSMGSYFQIIKSGHFAQGASTKQSQESQKKNGFLFVGMMLLLLISLLSVWTMICRILLRMWAYILEKAGSLIVCKKQALLFLVFVIPIGRHG